MTLLPDEIAVFRGPINRVSRTRQEAVQQVRETVIHELGHYFGLDDERDAALTYPPAIASTISDRATAPGSVRLSNAPEPG